MLSLLCFSDRLELARGWQTTTLKAHLKALVTYAGQSHHGYQWTTLLGPLHSTGALAGHGL